MPKTPVLSQYFAKYYERGDARRVARQQRWRGGGLSDPHTHEPAYYTAVASSGAQSASALHATGRGLHPGAGTPACSSGSTPIASDILETLSLL